MERIYITADQIEMVDCPVDEQETTVTFMRTDDMISVYSSDNTMITKLKKTLSGNSDDVKCWESNKTSDGRVSGYFFEMPKKYFTIKKSANSSSRQVTEEQREAARARFKKMWENKRKDEN